MSYRNIYATERLRMKAGGNFASSWREKMNMEGSFAPGSYINFLLSIRSVKKRYSIKQRKAKNPIPAKTNQM